MIIDILFNFYCQHLFIKNVISIKYDFHFIIVNEIN